MILKGFCKTIVGEHFPFLTVVVSFLLGAFSCIDLAMLMFTSKGDIDKAINLILTSTNFTISVTYMTVVLTIFVISILGSVYNWLDDYDDPLTDNLLLIPFYKAAGFWRNDNKGYKQSFFHSKEALIFPTVRLAAFLSIIVGLSRLEVASQAFFIALVLISNLYLLRKIVRILKSKSKTANG